MLAVLEGSKKVFMQWQLPAVVPLSTPEFKKEVLWEKVKDNLTLRAFLPDSFLNSVSRQDKDFLWKIIAKLDPSFAQKYTEESMKRQTSKKKRNAKKTIVISAEHMELIRKFGIEPSVRLLSKPKR